MLAAYDRIILNSERKFKNKITKIINDQVSKIVKALIKYMKEKKDDNGISDEEAQKQAEEITAIIVSGILDEEGAQIIMKELLPLWLDAGKIGNDFFNQIQFVNPEDGTLFSIINDDYLTWLNTYGASQVKGINATTQKLVQDIIQKGLKNGDSTDKIANDLVEQIGEYTKGRALNICQTETHNSFMKGNFMSAKASNFQNKTWVTAGDERVRETHQELDGMTINIDKDFKENLAYPGDSRAPASEVCRCRCILTYE